MTEDAAGPAYLGRETRIKYARALGGQIEWLERFYPEREDVIRDLILALLCRENAVLLGPPGVGKTALASDVLASFYPSDVPGRPNPADVFFYQCSAGTRQEDLVGPYSAAGLLEDRFDRLTRGKVPEAKAAILDEIFKPSVETLDVLLEPLSGRRFYFGTTQGMREIPLQTVVAMSNEIPEDMDRAAALWDRFLFRIWVDDLAGNSREEFLRSAVGGQGWPARSSTRPAPISPAMLDQMRGDVGNVSIPKGVIDRAVEVFARFEAKNLRHSTRRLEKAFSVIQAYALLCGRAEARLSDLRATTWLLWDESHSVAQFKELVKELLPDDGDNPTTIMQDLVERARTDLEELKRLWTIPEPSRTDLARRTAIFEQLAGHSGAAEKICAEATQDTFYERGSESLSPRELTQLKRCKLAIDDIQRKAGELAQKAQAPPDWFNEPGQPTGVL